MSQKWRAPMRSGSGRSFERVWLVHPKQRSERSRFDSRRFGEPLNDLHQLVVRDAERIAELIDRMLVGKPA